MADSLGAALGQFERKLYSTVNGESMRRIQHAAGRVAKDDAHEAAAAKLGADRAMSRFRNGRVRLNAGYDLGAGTTVDVNFRPAGVWNLADKGRRGTTVVRPKRRGGKRAIVTPYGPRASARVGPSRGLGVVKDSVGRMSTSVPKAAFRQLQRELGREFRG